MSGIKFQGCEYRGVPGGRCARCGKPYDESVWRINDANLCKGCYGIYLDKFHDALARLSFELSAELDCRSLVSHRPTAATEEGEV